MESVFRHGPDYRIMCRLKSVSRHPFFPPVYGFNVYMVDDKGEVPIGAIMTEIDAFWEGVS